MTSPWWTYPGIWEGRIDPVGSTGSGGEYGYGTSPVYGYVGPGYGYTYTGGYGYFSEHVVCLGKDCVVPPWHRIRIGEEITFSQAFTVTALHKFILFSFHMRVPLRVATRNVVNNGVVSFVSGFGGGGRGVVQADDGSSGLIIVSPGTIMGGAFTAADEGLLLEVSGATDGANNTGGTEYHLIDAVPMDQGGGGTAGDRVVLTNPNTLAVPAPNTGAMVQRLSDPVGTVRVRGVNWVGRAYCDWGTGQQERVVISEWIDHNHLRASMALHVSKYVGPLTVTFGLKAEIA